MARPWRAGQPGRRRAQPDPWLPLGWHFDTAALTRLALGWSLDSAGTPLGEVEAGPTGLRLPGWPSTPRWMPPSPLPHPPHGLAGRAT